MYDALIIGGGPAGLQAALSLGRARRSVLLCDDGPPRNAAAHTINNFVTRDKTPPADFRRIAREQLAEYPSVSFHHKKILSLEGSLGRFIAKTEDKIIEARRIILCTGMIDLLPEIEGLRQLWGKSAFICPFCHGWEVQDQRFAVLATSLMMVEMFAPVLRSWTSDVMVFTNDALAIPEETRAKLQKANLTLEERRIARLIEADGQLKAIELVGGGRVEREVLFLRPPQQQTPLIESLQLTLDPMGLVQVNEMRQTSIPGIYAAGDLTTMMQGAILAAAQGAQAAAVVNHTLFALE